MIEDLPDLEKKVYKVVVDYSTRDMGGTQAYFDPMNSKLTKKGYILFFTFLYKKDKDKIWKHYIYHEIHHGMQHLYMGKKRMLYNKKNIKVGMLRRSPASNSIYGNFIQFLYLSINVEQSAVIPQLYGKLKYRTNIKSIDDLKKYFKESAIHEFRTAKSLSKIDLATMFKAKMMNTKTGVISDATNREEMREFFSTIKYMGKEISNFDNVEELMKSISTTKPESIKMISDVELDATVDRYTKYFNKVGKKMLKKLNKTYSLLYDFYKEKFG